MWMPRSQTIPKPEDVCRLSFLSWGFALDATLSPSVPCSEDGKICDSKADSEWEYGWNMVYLCNLCVFLQSIPKQVVLLGFFTTHSNPTGRASAVVSPFGSAGLRSPSASLHHTRNAGLCSGQDSATSNQICSWKRSCHCKSLYYVRGTRVALGLPWGCNVLKACRWMSVGCSCRWRPMIGTSWRSGWAADSLLTWNFCHVKRALHWKGTKQCTASNCQGVSPLYVDLERVVPIVVGESCTTGVSWHWVQHQGASGFMQTKRWMIFKCLRCCKSCPLFLHLAFPNHISDKPLNMWYWYMFVFNRWRFPIHYSSSWRHPESSSLCNSQVLVCKDLQRNVWLRAPGLGGASLDGSGTKGTTINDVQICCVDTSSKSARDLHHTEPQWLCCIRMRRLFFCALNAFQFFFSNDLASWLNSLHSHQHSCQAWHAMKQKSWLKFIE